LILATVAVMATAANITLPLKLPDLEGLYTLDLKWQINRSTFAVVANLTLGEMPMFGLAATLYRIDNATLGFDLVAYAPVWHAAELHRPLGLLWNNVGEFITFTELRYEEEYGLTYLYATGTVELPKAAKVAQKSGAPDDSVNALIVSRPCETVGYGTLRIAVNSTGSYATVNANGAWYLSGDVGCVKELYAKALPALTALIKYAVSDILPPFLADFIDPTVQATALLPESATLSITATIEDVPGGIRVVPHRFVLHEEGSASSAHPAEDYTWLYTAAALAAAGAAVAFAHVYLRRRGGSKNTTFFPRTGACTASSKADREGVADPHSRWRRAHSGVAGSSNFYYEENKVQRRRR